VLFLLLAFSVFAWGTSYKLSLYKENPPGSVTPAKLCKLMSDNAKSEIDHVLDGHTASTVASFIDISRVSKELVLVDVGMVVLRRSMGSLAPVCVEPVLHLRPPPARTVLKLRL
jgi:hypothetical protein